MPTDEDYAGSTSSLMDMGCRPCLLTGLAMALVVSQLPSQSKSQLDAVACKANSQQPVSAVVGAGSISKHRVQLVSTLTHKLRQTSQFQLHF